MGAEECRAERFHHLQASGPREEIERKGSDGGVSRAVVTD